MATETAIQKTSPQSIDVTGGSPRRSGSSWTYRPNVDIFDTPDELLLIADLPGADPRTIDVSLEAGVLTIQAHVTPRQFTHAQSLMHEYGVGNFHRRFEVDDTIDPEGVNAEYRNGALTVHLPKAQQARRRRIPVSS